MALDCWSNMKRLNEEEQEKLRQLAEQQKTPLTTIKSKESSGLSAFYRKGKDSKKEKQELEDLKKKYFGKKDSKPSWFQPEQPKFKSFEDVDDYIERQAARRAYIPLR